MIKYVNDKSFPSKIVVQNSNELKFNPEECKGQRVTPLCFGEDVEMVKKCFKTRQIERLEDRHKEIGRTKSDSNSSHELHTHLS